MLGTARCASAVIGIALGSACAAHGPAPKAVARVAITPTIAVAPASAEALAPPAPPPSDFVYGHVTDENGRPLKVGHVRVLDASRKPLEVVKLAPDGRFALTRPDIQGSIAWLEFTGVDHRQTATLIAANTHAANVTVRLGTYRAPVSPGPISVVPTMSGGATRPVEMTRQADGKYVADVPAHDGFVRYELAGIAGEGRRVNGSMAESYVYDGDGDYFSVVSGATYSIHIVYDPSKRPRAGIDSAIEFDSANGTNAELEHVSRLVFELELADRVAAEAAAARGFNVPREDPQALLRQRDELVSLTESQDPVVRRSALVAVLGFRSGDLPALASQALAQVPPTDTVWGTAECAIATAVELSGGAQNNSAYVSDFVEHQPNTSAVGCYLFRQLSHAPADPDGARSAFKLLKSPRFAFTRYAQIADQYDPDRALAPGKPVPDFSVTSLDGKRKFSPAALRGKLYLIELWGPWCGPCVAEVPLVHAAYEKWSKQGKRRLHILSIAMDTTPDDLAKFGAAGHPMPWEQALAKDDEKRALRAIFGSGVPAYALIDEQGKLLAVPPELRAPGLDRILEDLNKPATK